MIPSQHLLPAQLRSVTLQEIRPPYNSELGSEVGTFYLVRLSERSSSLQLPPYCLHPSKFKGLHQNIAPESSDMHSW